ncbi:MAG: divalent cation tolerance protein CutA [Pseudonocardiaceae bacterium]|nr:divalent cation tolerance protein CutA [Pseudonocardiaceae bacterium]
MTGSRIQVVTTTDSEQAAATLARSIIDARLGACVQVSTIRSFYRWDDTVRDDPEWRLEIKTTAAVLDRLIAHIRENHSYDVPEVIATPIIGGNPGYLSWLDDETSGLVP